MATTPERRVVPAAALALAAGLALADASVVVLALPSLLSELDAEVEGVAAVIGVYTLALAVALPLAVTRHGRHPARVGAIGMLGFALASAGCGLVGSLGPLLALRAVQGVAAALVLVAAFDLLGAGGPGTRGRRTWLAAAVVGTAIGPALGGALTELLDWRAIFLVQAPVVALAGWACWRAAPRGGGELLRGARPRHRRDARPGAWALVACLGLLSAALVGVLFLLVLLLVSGWALSPLTAAAVVSVVPIAALAGMLVPGDDAVRAVLGCALVGSGVAALAFLALDSIALTIVPQAVAGVGMGMALPALAGGLIRERTAGDAARLLAVRHLGIALALALLAPIAAAELDGAVDRVQLRGTALVLDAELAPLDKLDLAEVATADLDAVAPRAELRDSLSRAREGIADDDDERAAYDRVSRRTDDTLVAAVNDAFAPAFLICAAFAFLAALGVLALVRPRLPPAVVAVGAASLLMIGAQALIASAREPAAVALADPCEQRDQPDSGGIDGFLQAGALELLDSAACRIGSTREELALALVDERRARAYEQEYGVDPRDLGDLLGEGASGLGERLLDGILGD
jgi:hypothetical protein